MKPSPAALALAELADSLGLTDKQRLYAETLAADPEQNQTHAAQAAGLGKPYESTGSRMSSLAKVRTYVAALTKTAIDRRNGQTEQAIASLEEALSAATSIMRMDPTAVLGDDGEVSVSKLKDLPVAQRRALSIDIQSTTDEDGKVMARHKLKRDPVALAASKMLVDHYEGVKDTGKVVNVNIEKLLAVAGPERLQRAVMAAIAGEDESAPD